MLSVVNNTSEDSLIIPPLSSSDTLPEIEGDHAEGISQLRVSDGDFHTRAVVNGESPA